MTAPEYTPQRSRLATSLFYFFALAIYVLCTQLIPAHAANRSEPELTPCHVKGVEALAQCADLHVPLDWSQPDGKQIALHVAVVPPSGGAVGKDPIYVLAGGPGQAASDLGGLINGAQRGRTRARDHHCGSARYGQKRAVQLQDSGRRHNPRR